jgi:hypothetical protein
MKDVSCKQVLGSSLGHSGQVALQYKSLNFYKKNQAVHQSKNAAPTHCAALQVQAYLHLAVALSLTVSIYLDARMLHQGSLQAFSSWDIA